MRARSSRGRGGEISGEPCSSKPAPVAGAVASFPFAGIHRPGVDIGVDDAVYFARAVDAGGIDFPPVHGGVAADEGGAAHIGNIRDGLAAGEAVSQFHHGPFGVAVEQDVGAGVHQQ